VRRVRDVEHLDPKLQVRLLPEVDLTEQPQVPLASTRAYEGVVTRVAQSLLGDRCERKGIEVRVAAPDAPEDFTSSFTWSAGSVMLGVLRSVLRPSP
jgi:hypothetical protein